MNQLFKDIQLHIASAFPKLFSSAISISQITITETLKEFEGDVTVVVFPLVKLSQKKPEDTAKIIGEELLENFTIIEKFNVIKGFLNLTIKDNFWIQTIGNNFKINENHADTKVLIEYSSPNTNKPIHLGHLRNKVLGFALSNLYKANNYTVYKANLINDRGIHICKSMLAWQKFGKGETPESSSMKGDKLVGKYYVEFDKHYKSEVQQLVEKGLSEEEAEKKAPILLEAQQMLKKWENGDAKIIELWKTMNSWVYAGFDVTYKRLGVDFDKYYYESNTYLLGKDTIEEGLQKGVFYKKEDGSVWIDLAADGLDQKLVLRADGTSVYITQDIGTAELKYQDFKMDKSIYVVGNEQDYHFKVLKLIMKKLGRTYADGIHHFSYGMVDLPSGKMKSREGTVVDADDLMDEMIQTAKEQTTTLGKIDDFTDDEKNKLFEIIGLGALKFFLLKVDPKKRILFDPKESIDLHGFTATFVQYTYARTQSVLRKIDPHNELSFSNLATAINSTEKELIKMLYQYTSVLETSCTEMNPAKWIEYIYELAKSYNKFYNDCPILNAENSTIKNLRIKLTSTTAEAIQNGLQIVGIQVPDRM